MAGVLSPAEFELFERLVVALESIAVSVEVRVNGRVITNLPEGSYETGHTDWTGVHHPDLLKRARRT